jgi:hypothetical protein
MTPVIRMLSVIRSMLMGSYGVGSCYTVLKEKKCQKIRGELPNVVVPSLDHMS